MQTPTLQTYSLGEHTIARPVIAAPMAGVSDKPYRQVCRANGAGLVVSEMVTSQLDLRHSTKSKFRMDLADEPTPIVVQLVGTDPNALANAAQFNVANGAQIIDINMGCPAKKVCKKAAGSALLADESLVQTILQTVVQAVDVPVTVKIRTGTSPRERNAVNIAKIAQDAGIKSLTVHGRSRECKFVGAVEYDTIARVKQSVEIPVIANGDIQTPQQALAVLQYTNADGIMIGRAAQGQPWLFEQVAQYCQSGEIIAPPSAQKRAQIILDHLTSIHAFYGESLGLRLARKHIKSYLQHWDTAITPSLKHAIVTSQSTAQQWQLMQQFLTRSLLAIAA